MHPHFKTRAFSEFSYFRRFLDVFLKLNTVNEILTIYYQLTRQSSLDRHPYLVFYDKVQFFGLGLGRAKIQVWRFGPKMNTIVAFTTTHHDELFDQFQT